MSLPKTLKIFLAIALTIFFGFNSLIIRDALAETPPNIIETQEFKQLIHRTHQAWNSHNPHELAKFYAQDADLIFYDALPMQYTGWN